MGSGLAGSFVGEVKMWAGGGPDSSTPVSLNGDPGIAPIEPIAGWVVANGAVISNTQYPDLVAELGTAHNLPSDSLPAGSVRLPNLQQKHPIGRHVSGTYAALGARGGDPVHSHNMSGHTHPMSHTHDLGSHTHVHNHTHTHDHIHNMDHVHAVNMASGGPSGPYLQAADAAGGPGWTLTNASHFHIVSGTTGGPMGAFTASPTIMSTNNPSIATTDIPSPNITGGSSAPSTSGPSTASTGAQSIPAPYVVLHFLIKT